MALKPHDPSYCNYSCNSDDEPASVKEVYYLVHLYFSTILNHWNIWGHHSGVGIMGGWIEYIGKKGQMG